MPGQPPDQNKQTQETIDLEPDSKGRAQRLIEERSTRFDGPEAPLDDETRTRYAELCEGSGEGALTALLGDANAPPKPKHRLEGRLGAGGMGEVLRVFDRDIRRPIAMKVLREELRGDLEVIDRFVEEAQIAGQLEHPNILPVYSLGSVDGDPYFTMKMVEGFTLRDLLQRLASSDPEALRNYGLIRRLQIFQQICLAMAFAHEKRVIHRDLKPDNVMLGSFGEVLVMDWGLATLVDSDSPAAPSPEAPPRSSISTSRHELGHGSRGSGLKGTPCYMSPEQAQSEAHQLDPRSDVYSLGTMLYELLTLELPHVGNNAIETLRKIVLEEPRRPSERESRLGEQVPEVLDDICLRALAKAPADRYASARGFALEVQRFIDGSLERERRDREGYKHRARGAELKLRYRQLELKLRAQRGLLDSLEATTPPHAPVELKRTLWETRTNLESIEQDRTRVYEAAHDAYDAALGIDPHDPAAREAKADLFWDYFLEAEERGDARAEAHFRARVEAFHDGKYQDNLERTGRLSITLEPKPDTAFLAALEEHDHRLVEREPAHPVIGPKPLDRLPPGPYVLHAWRRGYAPLSLPMELRRAEPLELERRLLALGQVPDGFIHVSGGVSMLGGDNEAPSSLPRFAAEVSDFLMARDPASALDYASFINDLHRRDPAAARRRLPRAAADAPRLWRLSGDRYELTDQRYEDQDWDPAWPIFGVSLDDARSYAMWLGQRLGLPLRLPSETEWEWAARGPSAHTYTWGRQFDATFCKMRSSRAGPPRPERIASFPSDRSPYGCRDMAGGVHEWCESEFDAERGMFSLRGGSWLSSAGSCRAAARLGDQAYDRHISYGFRLALNIDAPDGATP